MDEGQAQPPEAKTANEDAHTQPPTAALNTCPEGHGLRLAVLVVETLNVGELSADDDAETEAAVSPLANNRCTERAA
jgi:hypothetical protein